MAEAEDSPVISAAAKPKPKPKRLSCLTIPNFSDACRFIKSRYSCLVVKTHRRHLALAPKFLHKKRSGIKENLDAELLKYNVVLEGVPLAYDDIKIVGELGDIYDDVGYIHINIEADFVIFQPQCGQTLVGVVNKKAPSHIGCLIHGCFNASIPRPMRIPVEVWQCMEVNIGDQLQFEVFRLDSDAVGVFCIRGRFNKKMEADLFDNITMPMEENGNVPHKMQNASEIAEEEPVGDTSIISGGTPKKEAKKRLYEETLSQNEYVENQEHTNVEESPKKKRKKHKHQSVEVDGSEDRSAIKTSLKHRDSLQNLDIAVDSSVAGGTAEMLSSSSQEHKAKKSKKKKRKDHPTLESSLNNGVTEDSLITEDSTLEGLETEQGTTKKKHKKKHKQKHIALASSQETLTDASIIQLETPKIKKPKKKH